MSVSSGPVCRGLVLLGGPLRVRPLCCVPRSLVFSFSLFMFICLVGQGFSCLVGLLSHGWPLWPCSHFLVLNYVTFVGAVIRPSPLGAPIVCTHYWGYCSSIPVVYRGLSSRQIYVFWRGLASLPARGSLSWPSGEASFVAGARLCSYAM